MSDNVVSINKNAEIEIPNIEERFYHAFGSSLSEFISGEFPEMDDEDMTYQEMVEFVLDAEDPTQIARFSSMLGMEIAIKNYEIEQLKAQIAVLTKK